VLVNTHFSPFLKKKKEYYLLFIYYLKKNWAHKGQLHCKEKKLNTNFFPFEVFQKSSSPGGVGR
jgi:hypothetical protein